MSMSGWAMMGAVEVRCRLCGVDISRGHWGLLLGQRCDDCVRAAEATRLAMVADEVREREAMLDLDAL